MTRLHMSNVMTNCLHYRMGLWMSGLSFVGNLHGGAPIVGISLISDILDSAIRKSHLVFTNNVAILITSSLFTEVCVVFVIMDSIFKVEWIWFLIIALLITSTAVSSNVFRVMNFCGHWNAVTETMGGVMNNRSRIVNSVVSGWMDYWTKWDIVIKN